MVRGVDVVGAEWYWVKGRNASAGDNGNNAIVSLQGPQYDLGMVEHHANLEVADVVVDASGVGRLLAVGLRGVAPKGGGCSSINGITLSGVVFKHGLEWFNTNLASPAVVGENLLCAEGCDWVRAVTVENVTIGGQHVASSAEWLLDTVGNVTNVVYV